MKCTATSSHLSRPLDSVLTHRLQFRKPFGPVRGRRSQPVKALLELHQSAAAVANSSLLEHVSHHVSVLHTLAEDITADTAAAATATAAAVTSAAASASDAASTRGGDFLADTFESLLKILDGGLEKIGVPYSYGYAIILLTVLVKLATFPLSQKQVESTISLQALQPAVKELQAKYANDPEKLQIETARLYQQAGVNPLAGCLPTLATIPVFIGLYKALTQAAEDGLLTTGFYWIPSLGGPASLADRDAGSGLNWLFPFVDGHPPIGWGPAVSYLVLPVLLVVSQYASQKIISPSNQQSNDPSVQSTQAILKFLPLMIGWFSLNVPSGLTLYWFVNNILSTAQQLYLKNTIKPNVPVMEAAASSASATVVKPKEERVKAVTGVPAAAGKDIGARKKKKDGSDSESEASPAEAQSNGSSKGSKGEKFRALKAREAASKAASMAQTPASAAASQPAEQPVEQPAQQPESSIKN